jgi:hypothetical protein
MGVRVSSAQIFKVADGSTTAGGLVGTTGAVVGATTAVVGCTTGAAGVAAGVPHALSASESTRTDTIIINNFFFIFILQTLDNHLSHPKQSACLPLNYRPFLLIKENCVKHRN